MKTWLTEEERDEVRKAIDAFTWKHSWHLPTDTHGYTDWHSDETIAKCREVLEDYRNNSLDFAAKCNRLVAVLGEVQNGRALEAKEEASELA